MNREQAMTQLGDQLGVAPIIPTTITGMVTALGGTRATAGLMGVDLADKSDEGKRHIASAQRTLQRYMKAEAGERGKNVRGQSEQARSRLLNDLRSALAQRDDLRSALAQRAKAAAQARRPHGFHAKVRGDFFVSSSQKGRAVKPVWIDPAGMEAIIDHIQAGDYEGAAAAFDETYGISYDVPGMSWGETGGDAPDAYDSLEID